jgi:hypothetical protein
MLYSMADEDEIFDLMVRVGRIEEVLFTLLPIVSEIVKERKENN